MLWYQEEGSSEWEIIDGYQVILADDPKSGNLGETKNGSWVYVVEENAMDKDGQYIPNEKNPYFEKLKSGKGKVRFELYRVDDAFTLEGERLVSDTFNLDLTEKTLSPIEITDNRTNN